MATRGRKKKDEEKATGNALLEALRFIAVAQHSQGTPLQMHCRIGNKTVIGFDGGLAAGCYIEEVLSCCPQTSLLIAALAKCEDSAISITDQDSSLAIKAGAFRVKVPCLPYDDLAAVEPDPPIATLSDEVKTALRVVMPLAEDGADRPFKCGVLLRANTAVATNGAAILEAYHGIDLPDVLLPKAAVAAIVKQSQPLTGFGFSDNSATFYFANSSFIKTQLFSDKYPDVSRVLDKEDINPFPLPGGFFDAVDKVAQFGDNQVFLNKGKICSHAKEGEGASYDIEGLPPEPTAFNVTYLKAIREHFRNVHFNVGGGNKLTLFFGDKVRGGIMPIRYDGN